MKEDLIKMINGDDNHFERSIIPTISDKLPEILPYSYWLISGIPGTGKTALMDKIFVLDMALAGEDVTWVYRSMERSPIYKHAKWLAYILWQKEGVLYDIRTILQTKKAAKRFSKEDKAQLEHYYDWMKDNIFAKMYIVPKTATIPEIKKDYLVQYNKTKGKVGNIIHLTDHLDKITGRDEKYKIVSDYTDMIGELRDETGGIFCDIVQIKVKNVMDVNRRKAFGAEASLSDLYMGEKVAQNADVALSIIHPYKLSSPMYRGYDMSKFKLLESESCTFRSVSVIKTNFDEESVIPCNFIGAIGDFEELPKPELITDYMQYVLPEVRHNLDLL